MKLLKKSILLSLVAPLLFSLLSFKNAIEGEAGTVIIRAYENCKTIGNAQGRIIITESTGSRIVNLVNYDANKPESNAQNIETLKGIIDQFKKEGFKIESSNAAFHVGYCSLITTYILTK